jgi:hypothetical protein
MSTQFYTTDQQAPYRQTPHQQGGRPSWFRVAVVVIGTAFVAAIVGLAVVLSASHSSVAPATTGSPTSTSAPANGANGANGSNAASGTNPATPSHPVTPVQPSAAVEQLQRALGQLNYYEGPVDGIMGPQTTAAIKDLQRQAGLPQTGQMNAATQGALANYLTHGNNQMGGNS